MESMKKRARGTKAGRSRAWWRQSGNWAVVAIAAVVLLLVLAMIWRQTPAKVDIDQAAIAAAETSDPGMREIEARFRCPCGNCGHLELADCSCDVPGGAMEMKTAIARLLSEGQEKTAVIATIAGRFGGLKPESTTSESPPAGPATPHENEVADAVVDLHSSHGSPAAPDAVMRVAEVFDCPCGNCVHTLVDCTCDHAEGAVEVKSFISDRLTAGFSETDVIESVAQTFEARRTRRAPSATSEVSTIQ
jgi:cytochrome c-type biogenesis protein CcmH/NrfF